ncbi:hypothetical protein L207DRAFT_570096 [Hyaloscypha variabilis F]|uniref:Uncharacterized protein n=1 Tax=Hyaloscypha variabilis (strain UAMH 11265 / GT02V1 / F) TaxID=1149755 RepID=A0A2J6RAP5_HYAVF|nr:hypothetical protein L207DRAFT_570096 [Hyaloscypha variabilis F]
MGTRGLLGLIIKAQRHGFYNHFDSYPSGLGNAIVKFLQGLSNEDCAKMKNLVEEITWVNEDSLPTPELQKKYSEAGFSNLQVSNQTLEDWYCLLHKLQNGKVLLAIQNGQVKHLTDKVDFLKDGLFCEWAYFIDFEIQKLEIWKAGEMIDVATFSKVTQDGDSYMAELEKRTQEEE